MEKIIWERYGANGEVHDILRKLENLVKGKTLCVALRLIKVQEKLCLCAKRKNEVGKLLKEEYDNPLAGHRGKKRLLLSYVTKILLAKYEARYKTLY